MTRTVPSFIWHISYQCQVQWGEFPLSRKITSETPKMVIKLFHWLLRVGMINHRRRPASSGVSSSGAAAFGQVFLASSPGTCHFIPVPLLHSSKPPDSPWMIFPSSSQMVVMLSFFLTVISLIPAFPAKFTTTTCNVIYLLSWPSPPSQCSTYPKSLFAQIFIFIFLANNFNTSLHQVFYWNLGRVYLFFALPYLEKEKN